MTGITHDITGPIACSSWSRHGAETQTPNATLATVNEKAMTKRTVGRGPSPGCLRLVKPPSWLRGTGWSVEGRLDRLPPTLAPGLPSLGQRSASIDAVATMPSTLRDNSASRVTNASACS